MSPIPLVSSGADGISLLHALIKDIDSKQVAKRSLFSGLPFEIGPGLQISVKGYNIIHKQAPARSCFVYLEGEEAKIAHGNTIRTAGNDTAELSKSDIRKAYKFGGDAVLFTPEEQLKLKYFGAPGLRIIGFKPLDMLPHWASMKKSTFIYPSDDDFIGSTRVFTALWKKLLQDKKMGLGWFIARKNAKPLLVAIIPSAERIDELTGAQLVPQGLWLYQLPFADDIRSAPEQPSLIEAPDSLINEMRKVIQQLQLPKATYDPSRYPNPALQWHYRILQAMALDEEVPSVPDDKTKPKYRQIDKRAGEFVSNWASILDKEINKFDHFRRSAGGTNGTKRELDNGSEPPSKRSKAEKADLADMSKEDLKALVVSGNLAKSTVAVLKDFCAVKGLSTGGKKADLVERVEQWVEDN